AAEPQSIPICPAGAPWDPAWPLFHEMPMGGLTRAKPCQQVHCGAPSGAGSGCRANRRVAASLTEFMTPPTVSFIVPCYKLAHLLPNCVHSILMQTYRDFEVLIMDDCSPDATPQVAQSFQDPRVKHIRNDPNLGHLRNYNHGIGL